MRYNQLDSYTDNLVSNSTSLGFGNRRGDTNGLNFQNSDYKQLENIKSIVGEWNSIIGTNMANNLLVGWTSQNENRGYYEHDVPARRHPATDQTVYTSFGFEPFTPNNELQYKTFQVQNNFQEFAKNHTLTFGVSLERYNSINVFNSGVAERLHRTTRWPTSTRTRTAIWRTRTGRRRRSRCGASTCAGTTFPARRSRSSRSR